MILIGATVVNCFTVMEFSNIYPYIRLNLFYFLPRIVITMATVFLPLNLMGIEILSHSDAFYRLVSDKHDYLSFHC